MTDCDARLDGMSCRTCGRRRPGVLLLALLALTTDVVADKAKSPLTLHCRTRTEVADGGNRYRAVTNTVHWNPAETAIVICDMWNNHYCRNAARRVAEMAPRMN
ncbi:MAG: hypothetical protein ABGZ17_26700, partial [Planctomycetaceae bacterium]